MTLLEPLTFSFQDGAGERVELYPVPPSVVSERMWQDLAERSGREKSLIPYPGRVWCRRWEQGYAAIVAKDDEIISFISLVSIFGPAEREQFADVLHLHPTRLPAIDVFTFTGAWTDPRWRRHHVSIGLRPALLKRFGQHSYVGISGMAGLSSPVLAKLGWHILAWERAPFVSSLIALPKEGYADWIEQGWEPPPGLVRYNGPPVPADDKSHPWGKFCYLWVWNTPLAAELDERLCTGMNGDLERWRQASLNVFTRPDSLQKLAFLD